MLLPATSDLPALNVAPGHPHVITGGSKGEGSVNVNVSPFFC